MKPVIIIPARYGSTRFPGKPLTEINGKAMIIHVVEQSLKFCPDVYVATDDSRIFQHVAQCGYRAIMTSESHPSGTDRVNEAFQKIPEHNTFDVVVNLQGDEPFINPKQIRELTDLFLDENVSIGTQARKMGSDAESDNPNRVKVVTDKNNRAMYFSRSTIPFPREKNGFGMAVHVGIYAFRPKILAEICQLPPCELENTEKLEQLRWLWNGYTIHLAYTDFENISIDSPEDLKKV